MTGLFNKVLLGGVVLLLTAHPVPAIPNKIEITEVQLAPTNEGLEMTFTARGDNQPEIASVSRGNTLMINLANAQLKLSQGNTFRQDNPSPGITSVLVSQLEENSLWVIVNGANGLPSEQVTRKDGKSITISLKPKDLQQPSLPANNPATLSQQIASPGRDNLYSDIVVDESTDKIMRTYQLNEIKASSNAIFAQNLTSIAETGGSVGGGGGGFSTGGAYNPGFDARGSASTAQTSIKRTTSNTENINYQGAKEFLELLGANNGGANKPANVTSPDLNAAPAPTIATNFSSPTPGAISQILNGLEVIAEPRTNTLTIIGSRKLVEIATLKLKQLDVQIKQTAVNIKIVDVDLTKTANSNADLLYTAANSLGLAFNAQGLAATNIPTPTNGGGSAVPLAQNLLFNLVASIQNQTAKILTNPTLVVQESSSAQVNFTQEIFSGFEIVESTNFVNPTGSTLRRRPIIRPAGIIVNVAVERIDNTGFVTLNVSVEISAPSSIVFSDQGSEARLLLQRRLETGRVRLQNGKTLLLTGIIQDQDRENVVKVPILGDIPILGLLFRRQEKIKERREVVVVVTPQILDNADRLPYGTQYTPRPDVQNLLNDKR